MYKVQKKFSFFSLHFYMCDEIIQEKKNWQWLIYHESSHSKYTQHWKRIAFNESIKRLEKNHLSKIKIKIHKRTLIARS